MSDATALAFQRGIRAERARAGLTQADLARRMGWSRSHMSAVELGARRVWAHELPDLCGALGCSLADLLQRAPDVDRARLRI